MNWDHQLSRRFGSTSHFRLLNQLRSEIRSQPLTRDPHTNNLILQSKPTQSYNIKENKKYNYSQAQKINSNTEGLNLEIEENKSSFKDRLNAIDMR